MECCQLPGTSEEGEPISSPVINAQRTEKVSVLDPLGKLNVILSWSAWQRKPGGSGRLARLNQSQSNEGLLLEC